jgi:hypothetical protein
LDGLRLGCPAGPRGLPSPHDGDEGIEATAGSGREQTGGYVRCMGGTGLHPPGPHPTESMEGDAAAVVNAPAKQCGDTTPRHATPRAGRVVPHSSNRARGTGNGCREILSECVCEIGG